MEMGALGREIGIGIIGLGSRGIGQMETLLQMQDVKVKAVCDVYEDRMEKAQEVALKAQGFKPDAIKDYTMLLKRDDIEAVIIMTSWQTHITIAIEAMKNGKRPAMEVGGASSVDECWAMVKTSEDTGIPVMLLENCCYNDVEMAMLNMIRQGVFGELVHVEGGYQHDLRDEIGNGDINRHYRQDNFLHRNGELYPTHELGPIAKYLNINRGNRMLYLTSMSSKAVGLKKWLIENRNDNKELQNATVNEGDIVTTLIKCANGETITLNHDCTLPRPYSRGGRIQGTSGIWMEDGNGIFIEGRTHTEGGSWTHTFEDAKPYLDEYEHPLWKTYREFGLRGGHGGMDYLVLRAFVESVQNHTEPPIDVYDTAAWMAITCLSEQSVAMGSQPVPIPDFTNGRWTTRKGGKGGPGGMYALD